MLIEDREGLEITFPLSLCGPAELLASFLFPCTAAHCPSESLSGPQPVWRPEWVCFWEGLGRCLLAAGIGSDEEGAGAAALKKPCPSLLPAGGFPRLQGGHEAGSRGPHEPLPDLCCHGD